MNSLFTHGLVATLSAVIVAGAIFTAGSALSQTDDAPDLSYKPPTQAEAMKQMERWQKTWQPSKWHSFLDRFVGEWTSEMSVYMAGPDGPAMKSEGTATYTWGVPGKWIHGEASANMGGMPVQSFIVLGYDNFKQKYVASMHNSLETVLLSSEGSLNQDASELMLWGTLDEPMTGQTDKSARYHYRFVDKDKFIWEVHDLHIGGNKTKVVEVVYTRKK